MLQFLLQEKWGYEQSNLCMVPFNDNVELASSSLRLLAMPNFKVCNSKVNLVSSTLCYSLVDYIIVIWLDGTHTKIVIKLLNHFKCIFRVSWMHCNNWLMGNYEDKVVFIEYIVLKAIHLLIDPYHSISFKWHNRKINCDSWLFIW